MLVAAHWAGTPAFASGVDFTPLAKPQYKLYSVCSGENDNASEDDLRIIAQNFEFYHGHFTPEQADTIRKFNPEFKCTSYINSTYTRFESDVGIVESQYRDCLSMLLASRLSESIDSTCTQFSVSLADDVKKGGNKPPAIPIVASTIEGDFSTTTRAKPSTQFYVFWIRIGDELMRVNQFDPETGAIVVTRGFSSTTPTAHQLGANVFSPIYIGSKVNNPNNDDPRKSVKGSYPNGGSTKLRYVLNPTYSKGHLFLAESALHAMQEDRADGVWMDTLNTGTFNLSDCLGRPAAGKVWDFSKNKPCDADDFRLGQERKIAFVQEYIKEKTGKYPFLIANSLGEKNAAPGKGGLKLLLESTEVKPRPLDAFCMEEALVNTHSSDKWKKQMTLLMDCAQSGLAAAPIWGNAGHPSIAESQPDTPKRDQEERFGYASYLLAVEKDAKTVMGTYAFYESNGKRFAKVHPMYYYPIGYPTQTVKPEAIDQYIIKGLPVYRRSFTNGLVLVNPSTEDHEVKLDKPFLDPDIRKLVTEVSMPAGTGKILLARDQAATFRVVWFDNTTGTWGFSYDAGNGNFKSAKTFTVTGTNRWRKETFTITDAVMNNHGPQGAEVALINLDDTDERFHLIEVQRGAVPGT